MRAVVLARGLARRMRHADDHAALAPAQAAAAAAGRKAMMPVGEAGEPARTFLDYVLSSLADAGCRDVALVIGPEHADVRARYTRDARPVRFDLAFVTQPVARGTADAVLACERWAAADPFLVVNADNLYPVDVLRALGRLDGPGLPVFRPDDLATGGIPPDRIGTFALVRIGRHGLLESIVEKPGAEAIRDMGDEARVSMNCWRFDDRIFEACRDVPLSSRGELELPQAVGVALARGVPFRAVPAAGPVLDLSRRSDVAEVSRRLAGRGVRL